MVPYQMRTPSNWPKLRAVLIQPQPLKKHQKYHNHTLTDKEQERYARLVNSARVVMCAHNYSKKMAASWDGTAFSETSAHQN